MITYKKLKKKPRAFKSIVAESCAQRISFSTAIRT